MRQRGPCNDHVLDAIDSKVRGGRLLRQRGRDGRFAGCGEPADDNEHGWHVAILRGNSGFSTDAGEAAKSVPLLMINC
jgi:hypothetical protein